MTMCNSVLSRGYGNKLKQEMLKREDYKNKKKTLILGNKSFILK